jgi:hypothetical protein
MKKGAHVIPWTTTDEHYLIEQAGKVPVRDICRHLKRTYGSVRRKASRLGVSVKYYQQKLVWCDHCAAWRTTTDKDGLCPVCKLRRANDGHYERNVDARSQLTDSQVRQIEEKEAQEEQRKLSKRLKQEGDRVKQDTQRIRSVLGTNPRKSMSQTNVTNEETPDKEDK